MRGEIVFDVLKYKKIYNFITPIQDSNALILYISILKFSLNLSVAVRKLGVAILARSSREMSQNVQSTSSHEFAS